MRLRAIIRTACLACAVAAVLPFGIVSTFGEVPPSAAVRQQPQSVQDIIAQLTSKAAAAQGTWSFRSGPQNAAGIPWDIGIAGDQWFVRSTASAPAPQAGTSIYFSGEDAYQLPEDVHLQMDGVVRGKLLELRLGRMLLLATWSPKVFLGSLPNMVTTPVTVGGVNYIRVTSDPRNDEVAKKDTAVIQRSPLPVLEFMYDPQRQVFTSLTFDDRHTHLTTTTVDAWDTFGTASSWPAKLTVKSTSTIPPAAGATAQDTTDPVLMQVT
jgi:hypothetical protein